MMDALTKLGILADAARFDAACTSSGMQRSSQAGSLGCSSAAGICHSFSADGRCITLLKVLLSNACSYDCAYCVSRRSASCARATFEPRELAELVVSFYKRNYIEGLFLSSGVLGTPDATCERMIACLRILREDLRFRGYVHAKVIPGTSPDLVSQIGLLADRLSVNLELPSGASLGALCPDKDKASVTRPMGQIFRTRAAEERIVLEGRRLARGRGGERGKRLGTAETARQAIEAASTPHASMASASSASATAARTPGAPVPADGATGVPPAPSNWQRPVSEGRAAAEGRQLGSWGARLTMRATSKVSPARRGFAPAGQSTQIIVGASPEDDRQVLRLSQALYQKFDLKRVFFSAYMPMVDDDKLPAMGTPVPLRREHRLYQADWLMRYYAFSPTELVTEREPWLDLDVDPKLAWALRNIERFPVEVMDAPLELLLRVPGIGPVGARRIVAARREGTLTFDDLRRMRVTLKRARHFLTCAGRRDADYPLDVPTIRRRVVAETAASRYNQAQSARERQLTLF